MKKLLLLMFAVIVIFGLVACGSEDDAGGDASSESSNNEENTVEEASTEEVVEDEPINLKIDVNKEYNFKQFDVVVEKVEVYEKDEQLLADIRLSWTNRIYDYDTSTLFIATLFEVKQGGETLTEINDAWNPENKNSSDVFFPNAAGGTTRVDLTYELKDESTPIKIDFTPTTEEEGTETIKINLQ